MSTISTRIALGLCLEVIAVWLLLSMVRRSRVSYIGVILGIVAFIYHGVGELFQILWPGHDIYRRYVAEAEIASWVPFAGAALLLYAVTYCFVLSLANQQRAHVEGHWPHWSTLVAITVPLWILAVGFTRLTSTNSQYWADGLVSQFLLLGISLGTFLYIRQAHRPRTVLALIIQSLALALLGGAIQHGRRCGDGGLGRLAS